MTTKKTPTNEQLQEQIDGLTKTIAEFREDMADVLDAAKHLSRDLFGISAHMAQTEAAARQANSALTLAAELRHEWTEAKMLSKLYEQREFLGLPQVRAARERLLDATGMVRIGSGVPPEMAQEINSLSVENRRLNAQMNELADKLAVAEKVAAKLIEAGVQAETRSLGAGEPQ